MKSCSNCLLCCPKNGCPCGVWEMMSCEGMSDESIASHCTYYKERPTDEEPETERYYSPHEVYTIRELL